MTARKKVAAHQVTSPLARLRAAGRLAKGATGRLEDVRPLRATGLGKALRRALEEQRDRMI